jgi:hypothetical protein
MNYLAKTSIGFLLSILTVKADDPFLDFEWKQITGPNAEVIALLGLTPYESSGRGLVTSQPVCKIVSESKDEYGRAANIVFRCIQYVREVKRNEISGLAESFSYQLGPKYTTGPEGINAFYEVAKTDKQLMAILQQKIKAKVRPRDATVGGLGEQVKSLLYKLMDTTGLVRLTQQREAWAKWPFANQPSSTDLTSGGWVTPPSSGTVQEPTWGDPTGGQ